MSEGKYYGSATLKDGRRVQLSQDEVASLMAAVDESMRKRVEMMPDTAAALNLRGNVDQRLREMGWREDLPRSEGEEFALIEHGSSGIFSASIHGEFVRYAGCVGRAKDRHRYKHKALDKLTDDERATMAKCDEDNREWLDRELKSFAAMDEMNPATLTIEEKNDDK